MVVGSSFTDQLTKRQISEMRSAWSLIDKPSTTDFGYDGTMTSAILETLMRRLGQSPGPSELQELIDGINASGINGQFDFAEFAGLMSRLMKEFDHTQEFRETLAGFDTDSSGLVSASELARAIQTLPKAEGLEWAEIDEIIQEAEVDTSGRVRYKEFVDSAASKHGWLFKTRKWGV